MPNWCETRFTFEGKKDEVLKLYEKIKYLLSNKASSCVESSGNWLGHILIEHGFDWTDAPCRGSIDDFSEVTLKEDKAYFELIVTSAWEPLTKMWDLIIEKHYPSISYVFLAIETGAGLFINTDISGKHYTEKFLLNLVLPEEVSGEEIDIYEFYDTEQDLLDELKEITGEEFGNLNEVRAFLNKIEDELYDRDIFSSHVTVVGEFKTIDKCCAR